MRIITGTSEPGRPGGSLGTILVVEDRDVIRCVLSLILEGAGYRVIATEQGREALELARHERPDVITLELALADADGREVLRQLKHDPVTGQIPIVVISGFAEALTPADRWYAADVIPKPFDLDDLLRRLAGVVGGSRSDAERREGRTRPA